MSNADIEQSEHKKKGLTPLFQVAAKFAVSERWKSVVLCKSPLGSIYLYVSGHEVHQCLLAEFCVDLSEFETYNGICDVRLDANGVEQFRFEQFEYRYRAT